MKLSESIITPLITPHEKAPIFSRNDASLVLQLVLSEISSGNFPVNDTLRSLVRQASLVNLFFFLKCVAAYNGPYSDLTPKLHLDMCNFRQLAVEPGARLGVFVPRSSLKSTICTHGGAAWDMLRDPNIRIGIFSSIYDRAHDFFAQTQRIFDSNDFFAWVFPEYVPSTADGSRWNDREGVLPNRTRTFPEPNIKPFTAGGSTQGIHVDEGLFDDIVGDAQLNADHGATADMYRIKNWFKSSLRTLLISMEQSRAVLSATRYGIDDPYEDVMLDAYEQYGYWDEIGANYPVNPEGTWRVYYRMALEQDESIYPERYSVESLRRLAADDPWTYQTQYLNNPIASNSVEFSQYDVQPVDIEYDPRRGWFIVLDWEDTVIPLKDCDLVVAIDPAGVEKFVNIRTSRSVLLVLARTADDRYFIIDIRAGYVPTTQWMDWAFELFSKYGTVRKTVVEMQAGFKALEPVLRAEEARRLKWFNLDAINALGDKVVTIRNIIQPVLERKVLYCARPYMSLLNEELRTFPSGVKRDILDALKIAIKMSVRPDSIDSEELGELNSYRTGMGMNPTTGY